MLENNLILLVPTASIALFIIFIFSVIAQNNHKKLKEEEENALLSTNLVVTKTFKTNIDERKEKDVNSDITSQTNGVEYTGTLDKVKELSGFVDEVKTLSRRENNSKSNISNWRCACEGGFLPPSLLKSFGGAEAVFRMGAGQCYHTTSQD